MKIKGRIAALVSVQIALIITSFLIIVHFESQTNLTGNMVNVAGKNRVLTSMVQVEMADAILRGQSEYEKAAIALDNLEYNILFLRDGGSTSDIMITPLPARFESDWDSIWDKFVKYRSVVSEPITHSSDKDTVTMMAEIRRTGDELVVLSDALTDKLGHNTESLSFQLISLQIALCIINVGAHVFMITVIWRMFFRYTEKRMRVEKFAAIGELASAIAHDMRNPLSAIRLSAETIRCRMEGHELSVESETARIERCVRRMAHQIEGVMNHMRTAVLSREDASILKIIRGALETVDVPERITVSIPGRDAIAKCDQTKMEFVFANLLLNAIQSMGGGGGRIDIRLTGTVDGGGAWIVLEFENSGPPIPEDDLPRIFEPLFTTRMGGTGLGLASCKNIVDAHGGTITVRGDPVMFTIRLPEGIEHGRP